MKLHNKVGLDIYSNFDIVILFNLSERKICTFQIVQLEILDSHNLTRVKKNMINKPILYNLTNISTSGQWKIYSKHSRRTQKYHVATLWSFSSLEFHNFKISFKMSCTLLISYSDDTTTLHPSRAFL